MTRAILGRWGKSLALRLPREIASELGLREGETVDIETGSRQIIITRVRPHHDLATLFAGRSPEQWRMLYAHAHVWGSDVGREIVEE